MQCPRALAAIYIYIYIYMPTYRCTILQYNLVVIGTWRKKLRNTFPAYFETHCIVDPASGWALQCALNFCNKKG